MSERWRDGRAAANPGRQVRPILPPRRRRACRLQPAVDAGEERQRRRKRPGPRSSGRRRAGGAARAGQPGRPCRRSHSGLRGPLRRRQRAGRGQSRPDLLCAARGRPLPRGTTAVGRPGERRERRPIRGRLRPLRRISRPGWSSGRNRGRRRLALRRGAGRPLRTAEGRRRVQPQGDGDPAPGQRRSGLLGRGPALAHPNDRGGAGGSRRLRPAFHSARPGSLVSR